MNYQCASPNMGSSVDKWMAAHIHIRMTCQYMRWGWYSAYIKVVFWWTSKRKTTWNINELRNTIITRDVTWRVQRQKVERVTWGQQRSPDKSTSGQAIPQGNTTVLCLHIVDTCLSTNSDILYQKAVQKELLRSDQLHASRRHGWTSKTALLGVLPQSMRWNASCSNNIARNTFILHILQQCILET